MNRKAQFSKKKIYCDTAVAVIAVKRQIKPSCHGTQNQANNQAI